MYFVPYTVKSVLYIFYIILYIYIHRNITNVPELIDKSY